MKEMDLYQEWLAKVTDAELKAELASIEGDEEKIRDRFYCELTFGTAGLRGVLGAGTNRMNIYTVGRATQGLAEYLVKSVGNPTVAIAYDSRNKSDVFAKDAACILAANGVKAYLFPELMPTPVLSFAIRHLKTDSGIVITASHNPAAYNGYKAYGNDGAQLGPEAADAVTAIIESVDYFAGVKRMDFDEAVAAGKIEILGGEVLEAFLQNALAQSVDPGICREVPLSVVYTPLNGTGNKPVREIFRRIGVSDVTVVPEQELPDGNFTTCPYPNPEMRDALKLALQLCAEKKPDICIATDPDADRVGIAVKKGDEMALMTGNEVGVLLLDYLLRRKREKGILAKDPVAVSTIVSTPLAEVVARDYGCEFRSVLTGFKFIGGEVTKLQDAGTPERYILGFEESYGYMVGAYCRDKDAVVAAMLICEMTAYYKSQGVCLYDAMDAIYRKYGYYINDVANFTFAGESGMREMQDIMSRLRENPPMEIAGKKVVRFADIKESVALDPATGEKTPIDLPRSNVLIFNLEDGFRAIVRPSGTEPKLKCYLVAVAPTREEAVKATEQLKAAATAMIKG